MILDSGERRSYMTGAVRDQAVGKGRCDLMPLSVVAELLTDTIIGCIAAFQQTGKVEYLYRSLSYFARRYDNVYDMLLEVAKHFEEGALKYGENNWQKGLPVSCYVDSSVRHYLKWMRGDDDENHDRAFVWNVMCLIYTVENGLEVTIEN